MPKFFQCAKSRRVENVFEELKRYVRFDAADGERLRAFGATAATHFQTITDEFYDRLAEHKAAHDVFEGPHQVLRLKGTLQEWMRLLFEGPWDDAYYAKRSRIGHIHVKIGLPERYMFGAMNLIRISLTKIAQKALRADEEAKTATVQAIAKVLDLELAIMLETYREAFVEQVQKAERQEKGALERLLKLNQARYDEIVERGEALVTTFDPNGAIFLFSRRCEELTGISRTEASGRDWYDVFVQTESQQSVRQMCTQALEGRHGTSWEEPFVGADQTVRRIRWQLTTLPSESGNVLCAIGLDITDQHHLAQRARRAEHLASLGTMAAGLAHEIRNPLNAAHLQLTLMQRRLARGAELDLNSLRNTSELVASELQRLSGLVEQFLQFARPQPLRQTKVNLRSTVETVVALLAPEAKQAHVNIALTGGAPVVVEVDEEQMKQVLFNLVRNAAQATGANGRVGISVRMEAERAVLEVEDDGPGLPAPNAPIFEPFFTTKEHGTGLGLPIVHRIVTQHGGDIDVESQPGRTVFSVWIPIAKTLRV